MNLIFPRFVPREFGLPRIASSSVNFERKTTVLLVILLLNVQTNKRTNKSPDSIETSKQTKNIVIYQENVALITWYLYVFET